MRKSINDYPFGRIPQLRLANVPRWTIISMSKQQSVAEHSFNVALITRYILSKDPSVELADIRIKVIDALYHDEEEVYSGDIPTPYKEKDYIKEPDVIKLADLIDAYRFAAQYCNDTREVKLWLLNGLIAKINKLGVDLGIRYDIYSPLLEEVR